MLLVENSQRLPRNRPLLKRSDLASVDWLGASKHGMWPRTNNVESDAADINFPRWFDLDLLPNLVQACKARPAMAPRLLVESVGIEYLKFIASPAAPSLDSFRMGCHRLRPRWRVIAARLV